MIQILMLAAIIAVSTFLLLRKLERVMSAVTDLTAAVTNLTTVAEAAIAKLGTPAGDDPAVIAAVAQINTVAANLAAATNPAAQ